MLCGVLFGSVFYDISTICLISPIDNKTTIPLQIIRVGLFMIYRLLKWWYQKGLFFIINSTCLILLETHLLADVLRNSVLVYHVVHGVSCNKVLGHVPDTLVVTSLTPWILYHIILLTILVFSNTEDKHTMIISKLPVVKALLTLLLCRNNLWYVYTEWIDDILLLDAERPSQWAISLPFMLSTFLPSTM